ncbi:MAG: serine/threonine-protein kinase [Nannocystaceae bacterium]|nr:serine/threonine protein kinase [bacterium]
MSLQSLADLTGSVLRGRYRVAGSIGSGSMGDVYDGVDLSTGGRVALKVLKPERAVREVFRHRFLREAKSAVLIDHPNVVDVVDYGETPEGLLFIAMEFLEGEDLSSYLKRNGRLQWPHAVSVLSQVAAALAAAHDCGVVHRDVKPSNILLRQDGSGGLLVKLLDFGVAKLDNQMVSRVLTRAEDVVGTVLYMSPEQAEGRTADLRSDVYAFGVTAYQTLTGQVPFPGRDLFKVMSAHLTQPAPDPAIHVPEMPPWGSRFVLRCLEKGPEARYQSMHDVLSVLAGKATPDIESRPRPGTPIADPQEGLDEAMHPPLTDSPVVLDPRGPTMAGGAADDFDEAPTAYFQAARISSSLAEAVAGTEAMHLRAAPQPEPAPAPETREPSTTQPPDASAQPPHTLRAAPIRFDEPGSPFGPQSPLTHTVPSPVLTDDPGPYDPRPSRAIYVVATIGVLLVLGALAVVVGGW